MPPTMSMAVTSTDFAEGKLISATYAGVVPDGKNVDTPLPSVSPPLKWDQPPSEAHYVVLLAYDPDAPVGAFGHWVVYNLPAAHNNLPAGASLEELGEYGATHGATQGRNDFGYPGYNGPVPKGGKPHRYFFKVIALKGPLNLAPGAKMDEVKAALLADTDNIVAWGQLTGTYPKEDDPDKGNAEPRAAADGGA